MSNNIYLIGLMGAGKTTVGRKLAKMMQRDFFDADQLLEERTGVTIAHIFEVEGEAGFRKREQKLLAEIGAQHQGAVVSTGGGAVLRAENRAVLRTGRVVYLRAPLDLLATRLHNNKTRPLLEAPELHARLAELQEQREPLYANEAELIVEVGGVSAVYVAQEIHAFLDGHPQRQSD